MEVTVLATLSRAGESLVFVEAKDKAGSSAFWEKDLIDVYCLVLLFIPLFLSHIYLFSHPPIRASAHSLSHPSICPSSHVPILPYPPSLPFIPPPSSYPPTLPFICPLPICLSAHPFFHLPTHPPSHVPIYPLAVLG